MNSHFAVENTENQQAEEVAQGHYLLKFASTRTLPGI